MRNFTLSLLASMLSIVTWAQVLKVESVEKLPVPRSSATAQVAAISQAGDYLLLCSQAQEGLVKWDLSRDTGNMLTTARGAGFNTQISDDGDIVAFQEVTMGQDRLLLRSVHAIDINTGIKQMIAAPSRELQGFELDKGSITTVVDNKISSHPLSESHNATPRPVVSNSNLKLMLTINGSTRQFTPNGEQYTYIWASVSPNAERVLYYVSELGCYSCRLDGSDMIKLGDLRAPQWLDDNTVVGMRDRDNGITFTESKIIAMTLDGTEQELTSDDYIALYPHVARNAQKIAFSTLDGDIYIINYTK